MRQLEQSGPPTFLECPCPDYRTTEQQEAIKMAESALNQGVNLSGRQWLDKLTEALRDVVRAYP